MKTVSVSSKGQVVIPRDVRQRLGIQQGSDLRLVEEAGSLRLIPQRTDITILKGRLRKPSKPVSIEEMNQTIASRRKALGSA